MKILAEHNSVKMQDAETNVRRLEENVRVKDDLIQKKEREILSLQKDKANAEHRVMDEVKATER